MEKEPVITETALSNYIASRLKKEETIRKCRETVTKKRATNTNANANSNNEAPNNESTNESNNNSNNNASIYKTSNTNESINSISINETPIQELSLEMLCGQSHIDTPFNAFAHKCVCVEILFHGIATTISTNDIAFIDYTKNTTNGKLTSLNKRFNHNMLIYYIIDAETVSRYPLLQTKEGI